MTTSLTLATQKPFGNLTCDFYKNDSGEFYMTRDQIGRALEYNEPRKAIQKIHDRNADRLNPLSSVVSLGTEVSNSGLRSEITHSSVKPMSTPSAVPWKSAVSPASPRLTSSWTSSGMSWSLCTLAAMSSPRLTSRQQSPHRPCSS